MPAATITEIDDATLSGPNKNTFSGVWVANTGVTGASSNTLHTSTANAASVAIDLAAGARACYGIFSSGGAILSVAVDGVTTKTDQSFYSPTASNSRYLFPLARGLDPTVAHQMVVTAVGAGQTFAYDGAFVISGAKGTPIDGVVCGLGDSWMVNQGVSYTPLGFLNQIQVELGLRLNRPISVLNKGLASDQWHGSGSNTLIGGLYRLATQVIPAQPEFLPILFGVNDLRNTGSLFEFKRDTITALSLIEDCLDTSLCKVSLGTPGYISAAARVNVNAGGAGGLITLFEQARLAIYDVAESFPWLRIADVFGEMYDHDELLQPNASATDYGLHPNDFGHAVIARPFVKSLLRING